MGPLSSNVRAGGKDSNFFSIIPFYPGQRPQLEIDLHFDQPEQFAGVFEVAGDTPTSKLVAVVK